MHLVNYHDVMACRPDNRHIRTNDVSGDILRCYAVSAGRCDVLRQPVEIDLPESGRFWLKRLRSGVQLERLAQGWGHVGRIDGIGQGDYQFGCSKADWVSATAVSSGNGDQVLPGSCPSN